MHPPRDPAPRCHRVSRAPSAPETAAPGSAATPDMPATLLPLARPHSTAAAQVLRPPGTSSHTTGNRNATSLSPQVWPVPRLGLVPAPAAVSDRFAAAVGLQHHRHRFAQVPAGWPLPLLDR